MWNWQSIWCSLSHNKVSSKGASLLFKFIMENLPDVQRIHLYENEVDDDCMRDLGEMIKSSHALISIGLGSNLITDDGIKTLMPFIHGNVSLQQLLISYCEDITDASIPLIQETIKKSKIIEVATKGTSITSREDITLALFANIFSMKPTKLSFRGWFVHNCFWQCYIHW